MDGKQNAKEIPDILIVDDLDVNVAILQEIIKTMGYHPIAAGSAREALETIKARRPQLILLDISMPDMNGYELCEVLKRSKRTRDVPIIFISAMDSRDDRVRGFKAGAVDFIPKPFEPMEVRMRVENHLKIYKMQMEMEAYNYRLNHLVNEQMERIENEQKNILLALAKVTEGRDNATGNHLENISYNSRVLAQSLSFSPVFEKEISAEFIEKIGVASMLHDIGKIQIPDEILLKPSQLDHNERKIIKQHSEIGAHILEEIYASTENNDFLPLAINIARYHHERWNGTGYPEGLKGREIPIGARIVSLIDIYDTLTGERCYKTAYSTEESLTIIKECKEIYFDPDIVDVFMHIYKQLRHN